jgi:hypothetical protein
MSAVLGVIVLAVCLYLLSRAIQNARNEPWAGPKSAGMRSRAAAPRAPRVKGQGSTALRSAGSAALHPGSREHRAAARADAHRMWHQAFSADWLEQQRHARQNGGTTATATAAKPTLRQRLRLAPSGPVAPGPAGNGISQPAAQGNGGPPARQSPAPPAPASAASTNGGTTVAGTSGAAAEKMIEGIQEIYARAASGGLTAKQEAVRAAHEGAVRFAGMMQMLARSMSEPGSNYGPEITEPLTKAGQHFQAGAMSLSEADTNLETLANMTLREASTSPRQVPHHQNELSESGRH